MANNQDLQVKNLLVHDGPAYDAHGQLVRVRIVSYMLGGYGPFGITGLAADLPMGEVRRRIREEQDGLRQLLAEAG